MGRFMNQDSTLDVVAHLREVKSFSSWALGWLTIGSPAHPGCCSSLAHGSKAGAMGESGNGWRGFLEHEDS